jgi:DNA-binding transcriptional MerR regulator
MLFIEVYIRGDSMGNITYTFKEICEKTGYKSSVIRYYEKEFKLNILRDTNGRRVFSQRDIDKLLFIKKLQNEGYTNGQIKRIMNERDIFATKEVAASIDIASIGLNDISKQPPLDRDVIKFIEEKFQEINSNINELNQNVTSKERDIIISENLKLKMEIKQKSYEVIELKEKLKYEKEKSTGFLKRFFKKN